MPAIDPIRVPENRLVLDVLWSEGAQGPYGTRTIGKAALLRGALPAIRYRGYPARCLPVFSSDDYQYVQGYATVIYQLCIN